MKQQLLYISSSFDELDKQIKSFPNNKVFLVCGSSIRYLSYDSYFEKLYDRLGIEVVRFSDFKPNPDYSSVVKGVEQFNRENCNMIIAVGGGSAMDVAKCIKLYADMYNADDKADGNGEVDYLKRVVVPNNIPFIVIPTTAGTGSEATRFAVIYHKGEKFSVEHEDCLPSVVVRDSSVLSKLPAYHKKASALDALCHAIESFWSVNSNDESKEYSRQAIKLILDNVNTYLSFDDISDDSHFDSEKRMDSNDADPVLKNNVYRNMQHAAYIAGKAINITKTTAGHAMCYKLTTLYNIAHGHAAALCVSELFPYMVNNTNDCIDQRGRGYLDSMFVELAHIMGCDTVEEAGKSFKEMIKKLELEVPVATDKEFNILVKSVNQDRLNNNPIRLDDSTIDKLYRKILK